MGNPHTARRRTATLGAAVAVLAGALAACGSQLDPQDVAGSQDTTLHGGAIAGQTGTTGSQGTGTSGTSGTTGTTGSTGTTGTTGSTGTTGTGPGSRAPGTTPGSSPTPGSVPSSTPSSGNPLGDTKAGSCDGFQDGPGITDSSITIANASDISGPVPGLFQSAQQATAAFVAYFNATSDICGRKLDLLDLDTRADAGADQQAYTQACSKAFAAVGSMSAFDSGGAATAQGCGLPDVRALFVTPQRQSCTTCFAAYTIDSSSIPAALPKFWLRAQPQASQHVAVFYVDIGAAQENAASFSAGFDRAGMHVDITQGIPVSEFNYAPYVQQMKDKGIQFVQYFGPYQYAVKLQQAMQQNSFKPAVYLEDPTIYDDGYLAQAGGAGDGSYVYSPIEMFSSSNNEFRLYQAYLQQVAPGAHPNYYGLFAWSAARLFVQQAAQLGGTLSRSTLVAAMRKVKDWTDNGATAPQDVGGKTTSPCLKIIQLSGSTWKQVTSGDFLCQGLISTGVGG